jgi:hypothetical protein
MATNQAFIGKPSGSAGIPLPSGWTETYGTAVNGSGQVAGVGVNGSGTKQAFIGTTSSSTAIPLPSGWTAIDGAGYCCSINNSGHVSGSGYPANSGGYPKDFIGSTSGSRAIPLAPGSCCGEQYLNSLSNPGIMVGDGYGLGTPWIWDASEGIVLLSTLVPPGWQINSAIAVSPNGGFILATGSFNGGNLEYVEIALKR